MRLIPRISLLSLTQLALFGFVHAAPTTAFYYTSSPTSWVGQGLSEIQTPADGYSISATRSYGNGVRFSVIDSPSYSSWWYLNFSAPADVPLTPGSYPGATRWPFQSSSNPGLDFSGNGRGNNMLTGFFTILEAAYTLDGSVTAFAADFTQYDEGYEANWVKGAIRYNSSFALPADAVADTIYSGPDVRLVTTPVTGGGTVIKKDSGTVVLAADNTYSGATKIKGGTVQVGYGTPGASLGEGAVSVDYWGKLVFYTHEDTTVANPITLYGKLVKAGAGTVKLTGTNTLYGEINIHTGTLEIITGAGADTVVDSMLTGSGTLLLSGAGTRTLGNASGFVGDIRTEAGTTSLNAHALDSARELAVARDATLVLTGSTAYAGGTAALTGAGHVRVESTGTTTLQNTHHFTGDIHAKTGETVLSSNAINQLSGINAEAAVVLRTGNRDTTVTTAITGRGNLVTSGDAKTTLTHIAGFTGVLRVGSGVAEVEVAQLNAARVVVSPSSQLNLVHSGTPRTVAAALVGGGTVAFSGTGHTTLTATNDFNGLLKIKGGQLTLAGSVIGKNRVTVAAGTTVEYTGDYAGKTLRTSQVTGGGDIVFAGTGTVTLVPVVSSLPAPGGIGGAGASSGGTLVIGGGNTYSGTTLTVGAGSTLSGPFSDTPVWFADGAVLTSSSLGSGKLAISGTPLSTVTGAQQTILVGPVFPILANDGLPSCADVVYPTTQATQSVTPHQPPAPVTSGESETTTRPDTDGVPATFTGTYRIVSGRLVVNPADLTASGIDLGAAGTVEFKPVASGTVAAALTGAGAAVFSGIGRTTLTRAADFTGTYQIDSGRVALTAADLQATRATLAAAGELEISGDYAGRTLSSTRVAGTGTVLLTGTGELLLRAGGETPTFTGLYRLESGTLRTALADLGTARIAVAENATLELDATGATTLGGAVYGPGRILISGTERLVITGTVARLLEVAGRQTLDLGADPYATPITGDLLVGQDAFLRGQGRILGNLVNRGTYSPGNSPGVQTIVGDFTTTGTVIMEVAGTGSAGAVDGFDQINVSGTATLGGVLMIDDTSVAPLTGARQYSLINAAGGVVGTFDAITLPSDRLGTVTVTATGVTYVAYANLVAAGIALQPELAAFDRVLSAYGATFTGAGTGIADFNARVLALGGDAARDAVVNASPLALGALTALPVAQSRGTVETMRTRLDSLRRTVAPDSAWGAYAAVTGEQADARDGSGNATFDRSFMGGKGGLESVVSRELTLGGNLGYDSGRATSRYRGGRISQDHLSASAYLSRQLDVDTFLHFGVFGGLSSYDTERDTLLGKNTGATHGWDAGATLLVGKDFMVSPSVVFTPYAGLTYSHAHVDGFSETGTDLAYEVFEHADNSLRTKLGGDLDWKMPTNDNEVRLGITASWEHELTDASVSVPARFVNGGARFEADSGTLARDILAVGPVLTLNWSGGNSVRLAYQFEYGFGDELGGRGDVAYSKRF